MIVILVDDERGRGTFVGNATSLANCARLLRSAVTISPRDLRSYAELRTAIEVQAARRRQHMQAVLDRLARETS